MAAGNWTAYQAGKLAITKAQIDLSSTTNIFCVLAGTGYTPTVNTDATYADVSANEVTGTGYTAGGAVLPSDTDTATSGTVKWTSGAVSWSSSTVTAKYAVLIYRASAGSASSTDKLIAYCDLNTAGGSSTISTTNGTLTVTMNASGIATLT